MNAAGNESVVDQSQTGDEDKLEFIELQTNEDFKTKICLPYFKDIYKDL